MTRVDWTICLLALLASSSPARADQDAAAARPSLPPSGLTLARGALSVLTTAEINLAKDVAGEPISIAPDIGYGVTDDLTLVLVHSSFGTTGFRGAAGGGVCVTGEDGGCPRPYANAGLEGQVGLLRGPLSIAAVGGVHAAFRRDMAGDDLDLFILKLGARTRWTAGNLVVLFTPSFFTA